MKRLILIALCTLFVGAFTVNAQSISDRSGASTSITERVKGNKSFDKKNKISPEERLQKMDEKLNLNDLQERSIYSILVNADQKRQAMFGQVTEKGAGMTDAMRAQRKALRDETNNAILNVLNPEQAEIFKSHAMNKKGKRGNGNGEFKQKRSKKQFEE